MTTITINGQQVEATRIDELDQTVLQNRDHVVPAMREGVSVRLSVAQILGLLQSGDIPAEAVTEAQLATAVAGKLNGALQAANNLSDVADAAAARANIGADPSVGGNTLAPHEGLVVKWASNNAVDVDASALLLRDANRRGIAVENVDLTVDITASGANGLDTGAEASGTWYHIWVIYNPTTDAVAGLLSTSATAPTMPIGYTHKGYVGAVRNDSSGDFVAFSQLGDRVAAADITLVSGGDATSFTAVSLDSAVPPTAKTALFDLRRYMTTGDSTTTVTLSPAGSGTTDTLGRGAVLSGTSTTTAQGGSGYACPLIEPQTIYYRTSGSSNGRADIRNIGWIF